MINILIPLAGKNTFKINEISTFPRVLNEVDGKLLIERAVEPFINLRMDKKITVAMPEKEAEKYQLNKVIPLLGPNIYTCPINGNTQGAACSALLAIESLNLDMPLVISSFEQVLELDLTPYIEKFIQEDVDAGVLTFEAIHPKWSFVKTDAQGYVTQAAEKMPISKQAIAGVYFFKTANCFIEAAKSMIRKDVKTNNSFYIAPSLNEIILQEGVVKAIEIDKSKYFHINDDHSLDVFENNIFDNKEQKKKKIKKKTKLYIDAFSGKNINKIEELMSVNFSLTDPNTKITGRKEVLEYLNKIFNKSNELHFLEKNIFITDDDQSIIEFTLKIDNQIFIGTDVIYWSKTQEMTSMDAYLYEIDHEKI